MSSIVTILQKLEILAAGLMHDFGSGDETVFKTVKIYTTQNFNEAAKQLLIIERPVLVAIYGGSSYQRQGQTSIVSANNKAVDRRTARFVFYVSDLEYGFESKEQGAIGGGTTAKGAIKVLDLFRDALTKVNPKADWDLSISPFTPVSDDAFPVDPELGAAVVYSLTAQTSFEEVAAA